MPDNNYLFEGGSNIALKLPPHEFDDAVRFYRGVLCLKQLNSYLPSVVFEYGANLLWLDRVDTMTQAELWLELRTPDTAAAAEQLDRHGVVRRDSVETLPEGFDGFWISGPGNIIHLVHGEEEDV
jgi:catechol 2,3-dioxygenase-like lactoylglutathione lyase family enzyme